MDLSTGKAAKITVLCVIIVICGFSNSRRGFAKTLPSEQVRPELTKNRETFLSLRPQEPTTVTGGGGVVEGNGGEYITNEQNPWFLSGGPIHYCILLDASAFSANLDQARIAVEGAFKTWLDFLLSYYFMPVSLPSPFLLIGRHLAIDFREVSCDQNHELEFRFGVIGNDIKEALKYSATNVVALRYRNEYSDEIGRAKGQIWVSADLGEQRYRGPNPGPGYWAKEHYLVNVLTHELGHVYGVRHTKGGVMAADFPARMLEFGMHAQVGSSSIASNYFLCGKIEGGRENPDASGTFLKIFGLNLESVDQACFSSFTTFTRDYALEFYLKDQTVERFSGSLSSVKIPETAIKGQYLVQTDAGEIHYSPHTFLPIYSSFSDHGLLKAPAGDIYITVDSIHPSAFSLNFGYGGAWQEFVITKDSDEAREMMKLAQAKVEL